MFLLPLFPLSSLVSAPSSSLLILSIQRVITFFILQRKEGNSGRATDRKGYKSLFGTGAGIGIEIDNSVGDGVCNQDSGSAKFRKDTCIGPISTRGTDPCLCHNFLGTSLGAFHTGCVRRDCILFTLGNSRNDGMAQEHGAFLCVSKRFSTTSSKIISQL